jgi:hypothetical protein
VIIRWYLGGFLAAAAIGWVAAKCHLVGWAPVGLISLAAGILLGLALTKWAALSGSVGTRQLVIGALLLGLAAVFFEHAWLYVDFRRQWRQARDADPQVALFRPEAPWSPREYFERELSPRRVALWSVDAAIVVGAAVATVLLQRRGGPNTNDSSLPTTPSVTDL